MPNPNMGEPRYETKLRRSRRATLVDVGQDLYVVFTSIGMGSVGPERRMYATMRAGILVNLECSIEEQIFLFT